MTKIAGQNRKALANSFYNAISEEQVNLHGRTKVVPGKANTNPGAPGTTLLPGAKTPDVTKTPAPEGPKAVYTPIIFTSEPTGAKTVSACI